MLVYCVVTITTAVVFVAVATVAAATTHDVELLAILVVSVAWGTC